MRRAILIGTASGVLLFGACGTGEDPGLVGAPPADTVGPNAAPTSDPHTIEVDVKDGEPVGGVKREEVELGEQVRIVVTSDVADEVHVHGYDQNVDLQAGGESSLEFTADIPGVFVVELEERKEKILELEVK